MIYFDGNKLPILQSMCLLSLNVIIPMTQKINHFKIPTHDQQIK